MKGGTTDKSTLLERHSQHKAISEQLLATQCPVKKRRGLQDPAGTHRGFIFMEHLVVAAQRDAENDRCDILKAVDPLLAF